MSNFSLLTKSNQSWTWRDHLRWELKWSVIELIAVFAGLLLHRAAAPAWSGLGTILLCAVVVEAGGVRFWHYDAEERAHDKVHKW